MSWKVLTIILLSFGSGVVFGAIALLVLAGCFAAAEKTSQPVPSKQYYTIQDDGSRIPYIQPARN